MNPSCSIISVWLNVHPTTFRTRLRINATFVMTSSASFVPLTLLPTVSSATHLPIILMPLASSSAPRATTKIIKTVLNARFLAQTAKIVPPAPHVRRLSSFLKTSAGTAPVIILVSMASASTAIPIA